MQFRHRAGTAIRRGRSEPRNRLAAIALLLPLVGVAAISGVSLAASAGASTALDLAERQDAQIAQLHENLQQVSIKATTYLVALAPEDYAALLLAQADVDADLRALSLAPDLANADSAALEAIASAWRDSQVTLSAIDSAAAPAVNRDSAAVLEDALNSRLGAVHGAIQHDEALHIATVNQLRQRQDGVQHLSTLAVALAVLLGLASALWLLRQLKKGQEAVHRRERRLLALVEKASDSILVLAEDGRIDFATPSFMSAYAFGESKTHLQFGALLHPDDLERGTKAWRRVCAGGDGTTSEIGVRMPRIDGEWRHVWVKLTNRLGDPSVAGIVFNLSDVSEQREYEQRLTHQALHDGLTGLPNRELLRSRMERSASNLRSRGVAHSVLYIDLDDFKQVNDTLGHQMGDRYLVDVAQRLLECVRPQDMVARVGGDEFAVLLDDTDGAGAVTAAGRIIARLEAPLLLDGRTIRPGASIGVASGSVGSATTEMLLADADLAMYFAKRRGKGHCQVFSDAMRSDLLDRLRLGEDLRAAIESDGLDVHYQPIVDLRGGTIVGAEALARWKHPTRGWVGPDLFIPVAEEIGLVHRIDAFVLRQACQQGRRWSDAGLPRLRMAVNLSGTNLDRSDLVRSVARTLVETGFPSDDLELELTEGVAIAESATAEAALHDLKALGVQLAIDDFGTGYSALSRLRSLPFDRLKVDKAFIDELATTPTGPTLVDTILDMARVLGLEVVAEGVEHAAQAEYLRERNCDFAQGYLFSRPVEAVKLGKMLRRQKSQQAAGAA